MYTETVLRAEYLERFPYLEEVAVDINQLLEELLDGVPRIDKISTRAKSPDRFIEKALQLNPKTGRKKYAEPLSEIQDQIGCRVVVLYTDDVEPVTRRVFDEFRNVEHQRKEDPDPSRFGYEAYHFVSLIPHEILERHNLPVDFVEIQICTLFQHAWAEANHDLGYKQDDALDYETSREIALTAAQAWGADQIFSRLWGKARTTSGFQN